MVDPNSPVILYGLLIVADISLVLCKVSKKWVRIISWSSWGQNSRKDFPYMFETLDDNETLSVSACVIRNEVGSSRVEKRSD